jgi:hypothetical protein
MRVRDIRCLWSYLNVHPVALIAPISVNIVVDARVAARGLKMVITKVSESCKKRPRTSAKDRKLMEGIMELDT